MSEGTKDYSRGYQAGQRRAKKVEDAAYRRGLADGGARSKMSRERYDDLMKAAVPMVLEHCDSWTVGGKKLTDAPGHVNLAKIFVDEMISKGP